jgi:hypothetical protein
MAQVGVGVGMAAAEAAGWELDNQVRSTVEVEGV